MDYSVCNALAYNTHDPVTGTTILLALIVYDVACQYCKHFNKRLESSAILRSIYAVALGCIVWAIGKFHLGAHKPICYPHYSLNHKKGSGQVDGETMEPLWSRLNDINITGRSMSLAHRQENGDLGMMDVNWKGIVTCSRYLIIL